MSAFPTGPSDITTALGQSQFNTAPQGGGFDSVGSEDFLRIILSELQNQDPLSPNDTQALLDQIGTIRQIESDLELTKKLEEIASRSEISSAGSLVGTFVAGRTDNGQEVVGYVDSVSITRQGLRMNLGTGYSVSLSNVSEIVDPSLLEAPANEAPTVDRGIENVTMVAGDELEFRFGTDAFADADPDDVLSYSASQSDGSELPEWVEFDPATRTFTFNPGMEDIGTHTLRVTATDSFGNAVSETFRVFVQEFVEEPGETETP